MITIVTEFVQDVEKDQDTARHADRQSEEVEQRVRPVSGDISARRYEITLQHLA